MRVDERLLARIDALEEELAELRKAVAEAEPASPAATESSRAVSRRRLLWTTGAAAAGAAGVLGSARPAGAQPAPTASQVSFTPDGDISSTNVQAALEELDLDKQPAYAIDIRRTGAVGDGLTDNGAAIRRAIAFAGGTGGGMVLIPPGKFGFRGQLVVPPGVSLWGCGGNVNDNATTSGSVLEAMDPSTETPQPSQIIVQGRGGLIGNFMVDGKKAELSGTPPAKGLVYFQVAVERHVTALNVLDAKGTAVVADDMQNCIFTGCAIAHCDGDGLVLDVESASNSFLRYEIDSTRGNGIVIRSTNPNRGAPFNNQFSNCLIERGQYNTGINNTQLTVNVGTRQSSHGSNLFHDCWFHLGQSENSGSGNLVNLIGGFTIFDGCTWDTPTPQITALRVAGYVEFWGRNTFVGASTGIGWEVDQNARGYALGSFDFVETANPWDIRSAGPVEYPNLFFRTEVPHVLLQEPWTPMALRVQRTSEASTGYRFEITNTGDIHVNDGNGFTPKARLRLRPNGQGWDELSLGNHSTMTAPAPPGDSSRAMIYVRGGRLIVAYRVSATQTYYKYLDLTVTGTNWVHSTTAP